LLPIAEKGRVQTVKGTGRGFRPGQSGAGIVVRRAFAVKRLGTPVIREPVKTGFRVVLHHHIGAGAQRQGTAREINLACKIFILKSTTQTFPAVALAAGTVNHEMPRMLGMRVAIGIETGVKIPVPGGRIPEQRAIDRPLVGRPGTVDGIADFFEGVEGWITQGWMAQPGLPAKGFRVIVFHESHSLSSDGFDCIIAYSGGIFQENSPVDLALYGFLY